MSLKFPRQSPVQYKQAGLGAPLYGAHALFDDCHHLTPPYLPYNIGMGKLWYVARIYEVGLASRIGIEEGDQDGVDALDIYQLSSVADALGTHRDEEHEPVLDLKPEKSFKMQ